MSLFVDDVIGVLAILAVFILFLALCDLSLRIHDKIHKRREAHRRNRRILASIGSGGDMRHLTNNR